MKEKGVIFGFIKLNAKVFPKSSGKGDFLVPKLGFFFQSFLLKPSRSDEIMEK